MRGKECHRGDSCEWTPLSRVSVNVNDAMTFPLTSGEGAAGESDEVGRAQAGETGAREQLARSCRRSAYLLALQLLGDPDQARDVAQEAMLRLFGRLDRLDPDRPVRPWLFRVVRNRVNDLWRRRQVRRSQSLEGPAGDLAAQLRDPAGNPEENARRRELRRHLWQALADLPAAKKEILVLRDFHDLSYAEIADTLKVPTGTVMSRLHEARRTLREVMNRRMEKPPRPDEKRSRP
jgi:RNA polymerase sigma-70 factor (ECF subfamily)